MSQPATATRLILASSSPFRRMLLERLALDFEALSPDIDETAAANEQARDLVQRLAREKCLAIARQHPGAIVIGSDQVADLDGAIIGKPGNRENAIAQLLNQAGRTVFFHTGVCVKPPGDADPLQALVTVTTRFRRLTRSEIERYVDAEDVTGTAGSIKSEGLGITLVEAIESDDPTALIGLPLIRLREMLARAGLKRP